MFTCATQKHKKIHIIQGILYQWKDWEFYWTAARWKALMKMAINGRYTRGQGRAAFIGDQFCHTWKLWYHVLTPILLIYINSWMALTAENNVTSCCLGLAAGYEKGSLKAWFTGTSRITCKNTHSASPLLLLVETHSKTQLFSSKCKFVEVVMGN